MNRVGLLVLIWIWSFVNANKEIVSNKVTQVCSGMYSKKDWNGKVDPFISFTLETVTSGISVVIFDLQDYSHIGAEFNDRTYYICDEHAIRTNLCDSSNKGQFIVNNMIFDSITGKNYTNSNQIITFYQDTLGLNDIKYPVKSTGYYCVITYSGDDTKNNHYKAVVNFRNAFGNLPAAEINKLPLYGLLAIFYLIAMALYSFTYWKHRHESLLLQKYLLAFFLFLTVETIFIWAYYDIKNEKGDTAGTKAYMVFVSILNSAKISSSFFLILIISLGYGIVYPKLNRTLMKRIKLFTLFQFLLSVGYLIQNYLTNPESISLWPLVTLVPLALSIMGFYFVILKSMSQTLNYLQTQRQVVKLKMYKHLLTVIYISLVTIFGGIVLVSFVFIGMNTIEMVEHHWKTRFFFVDFWPSLVYYFVFVAISFIWRPTSTSYMLACSQQLPTDPENVADFDLDDLQSLNDNENLNTFQDDDLNFTDDESDQHLHENGNIQPSIK